MDREQLMGEVQDEVESVGSDVGGTIPPLQGADLPIDAALYMSEEFRRKCMPREEQNCQCTLLSPRQKWKTWREVLKVHYRLQLSNLHGMWHA